MSSFITLVFLFLEIQSLTRKLDIKVLSQLSLKIGHYLIIMGAFSFPFTKCIDVPSFITLALVVPEKQS